MPWQLHPYSLLLAVSAGMAALVARFAWRRRPAPGAVTLTVLNLALAEWAGAYAIQWTTTTLRAQVFWLSATFLGVAVSIPALLVFALQYGHHMRWLTRRSLALLAVMPALTVVVMATDPLHHLFYAHTELVVRNGYVELHWVRGPWFWLVTGYSYILLAMVAALLVRAAWHAPRLYRAQAGSILAGALFPWSANFFTQAVFRHHSALDLTPVAFTLAALAMTNGLLRHRLLDLVPVARSVLIENMPERVVVVDAQDRVVDLNPSARRAIGPSADDAVGQPIEKVLVHWQDVVERFRGAERRRAELDLGGLHLDLHITPLCDRRGRLTGRLITWRDISDRKRAEAELRQANEQLRRQLEQIEALQARLREEIIRDPLTGLYNRRYLNETLPRELSRAERESYPVALTMLDLDRFKAVNDTHGHTVGDKVLVALSDLLRAHSRAGDLACRYGGEEFLMVLPNTTAAAAWRRADAWRQACATMPLTAGAEPLTVTLSAGVAAYPADGHSAEQLLIAADQALYAAKATGRNRVVRAS